MRKSEKKRTRSVLSGALVTVLCFMLFIPVVMPPAWGLAGPVTGSAYANDSDTKDIVSEGLAGPVTGSAYANGGDTKDIVSEGLADSVAGSARANDSDTASKGLTGSVVGSVHEKSVGTKKIEGGAMAREKAAERADTKRHGHEPLPGYALLPDGAPDPAFVGADGELVTVSPDEFEEIVANWENPKINTEGLPNLLELLGHIPRDLKPGETVADVLASEPAVADTPEAGIAKAPVGGSVGSVGQVSGAAPEAVGGTSPEAAGGSVSVGGNSGSVDPGSSGTASGVAGGSVSVGGNSGSVDLGSSGTAPGVAGGSVPAGGSVGSAGQVGGTVPEAADGSVPVGGSVGSVGQVSGAAPEVVGGTSPEAAGRSVSVGGNSGSVDPGSSGSAPGVVGGTAPEVAGGPASDNGGLGGVNLEGSVAGLGAAGGAMQIGIAPAFADITPYSVDFPYFFHLAGQTDPYGSGHSYRQYYVPAGYDIPLLSFCLEMGKNAPPDSVKVAYTPMAAPGWSTALATYAPSILASYGIDTISDNANRQWAMQDAVWVLTGASIGAASGEPVIQSLVDAAHRSVSASKPVFLGISDGGMMTASPYSADLVRYGPLSISGMSGNAQARIFTDDGNTFPAAWIGDASGAQISLSSVPGGEDLYVYMPTHLYETGRINIEVKAPYTLPSYMQAFQAPDPGYQNQLVMMQWTSSSGTVSVNAKLGGFGECDVMKLDAGWRTDFREADYNGDGKGDVYLLSGAEFAVQQWGGDGFVDTDAPVAYQAGTRAYHVGFLVETEQNGGRFQVVESKTPYGYRNPIVIPFDISARYNLAPGSAPGASFRVPEDEAAKENANGDGLFFALNTLLNVRIEFCKRDKAEKAPAFQNAAYPQGDASLGGAYYGLFYSESVIDPSGISHKAGDLVCIGVTDAGGRIVFDNSDAERAAGDRRLVWSNSNTSANFGSEDFPIFLPAFERQDRRIFPAKYYIQEIAPSKGYLLDIDPLTAKLDSNGVPVPGTGAARKYEVDARDNGSASNPSGIRLEATGTEQVKMRGFLLRKVKSDGNETEIYNLNGAGFSVYLISDLVSIIKQAAASDPSVKIPKRGPGGWDKQDFMDFFYDADFVYPIDTSTGKDWYNHETNLYTGRYDFERYPDLKRARIDYSESQVFYSGAGSAPGLRYGNYGNHFAAQDGEVVFPEFPYGEYIVFETFTPAGHERVKPFVVNIAEDGGDIIDGDGLYNSNRPEQSWRIQIDSDMFSIRLWKKDAETGKTVIGKDAAFRLKYLGADGGADDKWVEMTVPGPNGIERWGTEGNPFRVGDDGVLILPKKLQAGSYKLYETEAPDGYVLSYHEAVDDGGFYQATDGRIHKHGFGQDAKAGDANFIDGHFLLYKPTGLSAAPQPAVGIVFDVNEAHRISDFDIDEDGYDDFAIELVQYNEQQKGRLNIHKEKENAILPENTDKTAPFEGVRFELYAADDILSLDGHGNVLYEKGEFVAATSTDAMGDAYFKDLYLGKYSLKEADIGDSSKTRINGRLVSGYKFVDGIEIDLSPPPGAGLQPGSAFYQENPVVSASWSMLNVWQLGTINVYKSGEKPKGAYMDDATGGLVTPYEEEPLGGVVFEAVADEDIHDFNTGETIWKKGDVAGTVVTDEEGNGSLSELLPGEYTLRETDAPDGYVFADDRRFTINGRGHTDAFEWYTWDIFDVRQKLSIMIEKVDDTDGHGLSGAVFGLFAAEDFGAEAPGIVEGAFMGKAVSGEDGKASFRDLPPGRYIVREISPPPGYSQNSKFAPEIPLAYDGHTVEYLTWTGVCVDATAVSVEVDKDTIRRTSAAFVSLPRQGGRNNVGDAQERFRYDIDFRLTSAVWVDEFVVDDPLENVNSGKVFVEELWTPVVWGDYDGLWNLWYATNKTNPKKIYSNISAMDTNPFNPDNPDGIAVYPNNGLKLLAQGLRTDQRYHFSLEDFGLEKDEYITSLRFEYGRVEVGFTSKNYASESLNGEHRTVSGKDLNLPSNAAGELKLIDPALFPASGELNAKPGTWFGAGAAMAAYMSGMDPGQGVDPSTASGGPGLGERSERVIQIAGAEAPSNLTGSMANYVTGINGDIVDWTPREDTRFFAEGAKDPGYELKPATYLVSAAKPMTDVDIVNSASARIARDIVLVAYDQDAVVTKVIDTFKYDGKAPKGADVKTGDSYQLLAWLIALLSASLGLLILGRVSLNRRYREKRSR